MRNESEKIALSQIVGTYFIRLNRLSDLISQAYAGSDATEINFFIDIYSIRNDILSRDFTCSSPNELCSLILDMVVFGAKHQSRDTPRHHPPTRAPRTEAL